MSRVIVESERETDSGWRFVCRYSIPSGDRQTLELGLSWADYDLWAPDGSVAPEHVAAAVLDLLLEYDEEPARHRIDAAHLRRMIPGSDEMIQKRIRRPGISPGGTIRY
jgi:hypothetical protein